MAIAIEVKGKPKAWYNDIRLQKYKSYLKKLGVEKPSDLKADQKELLLLMAIDDFYNWSISLDELSSICNELQKEPFGEAQDLLNTLISGSEISWSIRNSSSENNDDLKSFVNYFNDLQQYFKKNKHLIKDQKRLIEEEKINPEDFYTVKDLVMNLSDSSEWEDKK